MILKLAAVAGGLAGAAGPPLLLVIVAMGSSSSTTAAEACAVPLSPGAGTALTAPGVATLEGAEQSVNARTIVATGIRLGVPAKGLVVGIATAMQESGLRNLAYGDRDSVGLFQQRAGWGTFAQRTDPAQAAAMFFTGGHAGQPGLLDISGWQSMPVTQAAQAVQRSAFPLAYAKRETQARTLVARIAPDAPGDTGQACTAPPAAPAGTWVLPVNGYVITSPFGRRYHPVYHRWTLHAGVDLAVPTGTTVSAAAAGQVTIAGGSDPAGYGQYVEIDHGGGIRTRYAHLSRVDVQLGVVDAGVEVLDRVEHQRPSPVAPQVW